MNWEQRWRDLVVAGGAVAVTACGSSSSSPTDAPSDTPTDAATSPDTSLDAGTGDADFIIIGPVGGGCCNASPDPCCYLGCAEGPDASDSDYLSCEQARSMCHDGFYEPQSDGSLGCSYFPEAGLSDAGITDAASAADGHD